MSHHRRITQAVQDGGITRVLLIDDAFDAPLLNESFAPQLLDYLEGVREGRTPMPAGTGVEAVNESITALEESRLDDESLFSVLAAIYERFSRDMDAKFDVDGTFMTIKGAALASLQPLLALLESCGDAVAVCCAGLSNAREKFDEQKSQLVFLDFFLSPPVPVGSPSSGVHNNEAFEESIKLLQDLTNTAVVDLPAVVLMSSESVGDRAKEFRERVNAIRMDHPRVLSWRFAFIEKGKIALNDNTFDISPEVADALLDTSQSHKFGMELHKALEVWRSGVDESVSRVMRDIANLDIKDFAYLIRFRLIEEGQPFSQYIQWLFGEYLLDAINRTVEWNHSSFHQLDSNGGELSNLVEGAYDGATKNIATMFDRARIEQQRRSEDSSRRLGDIYFVDNSSKLRAIVTPDCDLVRRDGKVNVQQPLTVGGELRDLKAPNTSLSDFIIKENVAYSIQWKHKDLETIDLDAENQKEEGRKLTYAGTLRPLYAQDLQRSVLNNLGRIGLSVAPVIGMSASASVYIRAPNKQWFKLEDILNDRAWCTIMPPRGGNDKSPRVVFYRKFVHTLIEALRKLDKAEVHPEDHQKLDRACETSKEDEYYMKLCLKGVTIGKVKLHEIDVLIDDKPSSKQGSAWCQIVVTYFSEEDERLLLSEVK